MSDNEEDDEVDMNISVTRPRLSTLKPDRLKDFKALKSFDATPKVGFEPRTAQKLAGMPGMGKSNSTIREEKEITEKMQRHYKVHCPKHCKLDVITTYDDKFICDIC